MKLDNELTLDQIDDYNNNESPKKRRIVWLVIAGLLLLGAVYSFVQYSYDTPGDYVGTPETPGISTVKR